MALISSGFKLLSSLSTRLTKTEFQFRIPDVVQVRNYAARKGTRERKNKKKVKVEVQKVGFIPHNLRNREKFLASRQSRKVDDTMKAIPVDDVYVAKYYKWKVYSFEEAIECHRETHHPEMYNQPCAPLHASIELNMQGEKKTKFVENFTRICGAPHRFDHGEDRTIIAFSKDEETNQKALEAGAQLTGGVELIKQFQDGKLSLQEFQFIVAHPNILPELVSLRGLMKKKFPNAKAGTLDADLEGVVKKFIYGIKYSAVKDEYEKDFGIIDTVVGTLNMTSNELEENFSALVKDINSMRPKRSGTFLSRILLWSPPSREKLLVNFNSYVDDKSEIQSDTEEVEESVAL